MKKMSPTTDDDLLNLDHLETKRTILERIYKIPKILRQIYGLFRMITCLIHNLYCIPSYLFLNFLLLPFYYISIESYSKIENVLYYSLLYVVGYWSYACGMIVHEHGDDIQQLIKDKNNRIVVIANHQSTADVPMMFQALAEKANFRLLWIMDRLFKWTNFGVVSQIHGDYFLNAKNYIPESILNHCRKRYSKFKNMFILFPEGGFRYKRMQSSASFATKRNYPILQNVTYPRVNGFKELLHDDLGITHVVDLTICYDDADNSPSIVDSVMGIHRSEIHFYYKIHVVKDTPNIDTEEWLYEQWQKKEALLANHYVAIRKMKYQNHHQQQQQIPNPHRNQNLKSESQEFSSTQNSTLSSNLSNDDLSQQQQNLLETQLRKREKSPTLSQKNLFSRDSIDDSTTNPTTANGNGDLSNQHLNHNNNNNNNNDHRHPDHNQHQLKFKSYREFSDLYFDLHQGRQVKYRFLKVVLLHFSHLMVSAILYSTIFLIISLF